MSALEPLVRLRDLDGKWEKDGNFRDCPKLSVPWWVRRVSVESAEGGGDACSACAVSRLTGTSSPVPSLWFSGQTDGRRVSTPRLGGMLADRGDTTSASLSGQLAAADSQSTPLSVGVNEMFVQCPARARLPLDAGHGPTGHSPQLLRSPTFTPRRAGGVAVEEPLRPTEPLLLTVERQEPLALWLTSFPSFELARLSVVVFVYLFFLALRWEIWSLLAAPVLAIIPLGRVCPEFFAPLSGRGGKVFAKSEQTVFSITSCVALVWIAYVTLAWVRSAYGPNAPLPALPAPPKPPAPPPPVVPKMDCSDLDGLDCSGRLEDWAGLGNCVFLTETDGTCKDYCEKRGRTCVKASDNSSYGCTPQQAGFTRQTTEDHGCLQDWRTQICACSPQLPASPSAADVEADRQREREAAELKERLEAQERQRLEARAEFEREQAGYYERTTTSSPIAPPASSGESAFKALPPCFTLNAEYVPAMYGQASSVTPTARSCQDRCARTAGCAHFTWRPDQQAGQGDCSLQDHWAQLQVAPHAVVGPSDCHQKDGGAVGTFQSSRPPWDDEPLPDSPSLSHADETSSYRMQDAEGDTGTYVGAVDARGKANGLGELRYDQGPVFMGNFDSGHMWEGVVYTPAADGGVAVQDTMKHGRWTSPVDWNIVSKYPSSSSTQQPTPPPPSPPKRMQPDQMESQREWRQTLQENEMNDQEVPEASTIEPFLAEGSPIVVIIVVVAFWMLAASGKLDRPPS